VFRPLGSGPWDVSFDLRVGRRGRIEVTLGYVAPVAFSGAVDGSLAVRIGGRYHALPVPAGWLRGLWHVEATNRELWVDGRSFAVGRSRATELGVRLDRGSGEVSDLIISAAADRGALLLHRLAELHARIPVGRFPIGAGARDQIVYGNTYWTSGFWAGALWQAAALLGQGAGKLFAGWALPVTIAHFGRERADSHDVGFAYGQSSLAAWRALCTAGRPAAGRLASLGRSLCARLRASVLSAADELLALAASNARGGTIPTDSTGPQADTIIDSMMNIAILPWASRVTGNPAYVALARRHAQMLESLLVRADGSTAQSVLFDRATGQVLSTGTHQGLAASSTWARGEGWALYGFAQAALDLRERRLLSVALRLADYVARRLPAGGIPRWDYDAPPGAPVDVSAGVITAAGLFHLAQTCHAIRGVCRGVSRWTALGSRMLAAALGRASARPPLGFLGGEILNEHGRGCWCDGGELSFGLSYALEGLALEHS
jgi:hypothetical protein